MAGKVRFDINLDRLHAMYRDSSIPMKNIAERFGCSRRRINEIIAEQRKIDPQKWALRN